MTSNRPQNLTQGRSRHAEAESEVKSWRFLHPEAKIKENRPKMFVLNESGNGRKCGIETFPVVIIQILA